VKGVGGEKKKRGGVNPRFARRSYLKEGKGLVTPEGTKKRKKKKNAELTYREKV